MIPLNVEQHLGHKAFILFLLRRITVAVLLLIVTIIIMAAQTVIAKVISDNLIFAATVIKVSAAAVYLGLSYFIGGLFIITLILFLVGVLISSLEYKNYAFTIEEFDLKMRQGIFDRQETSIPLRQIQDLNIKRTLVYQLLGLSKLIIMTAGSKETEHETSQIILEPIAWQLAEEIRSQLQRQIGVQLAVPAVVPTVTAKD